MNFLVVGQGGREHAMVKALKSSAIAKTIHVIPGNPGMALEAQCHQLEWKNFEEITQFCRNHHINVVIIGPEDPCVMGLSDCLRAKDILVVGPSKAAAQLEGSKVFAKEFMLEFGVSTAKAVTVRSVEETLKQATEFTPPYVLKADGLAAGKGVVLCSTLEQLQEVAQQFFEQKLFGQASEKALLEQFLPGYELSLHLMTDGKDYQVLPLAQDHKQLRDGDQGPNTGGMGAVAPMFISDSLMNEIKIKIIEPTLKGLGARELFYRGMIFLGLMITKKGPMLLEYNCRMGDPETQVLMPLLEGDWGKTFHQLALGQLIQMSWKNCFSTCVVLAAPGYPDSPEKGIAIEGELLSGVGESAKKGSHFDKNSEIQSSSHVREKIQQAYFIHAGTRRKSDGQWQTAGGRVLGAVGIGATKEESRARAYEQAEQVSWKGLQKRMDIGLRSNDN